MNDEPIELRRNDGSYIIVCRGEWTLYHSRKIERAISRLELPSRSHCSIDFEEVDAFDSTGVLLLLELKKALRRLDSSCDVTGLDEKQRKMLSLMERGYDEKPLPRRTEGFLNQLGRSTIAEINMLKDFLRFLGTLAASFFRILIKPSHFRVRETVYHIEHSGFNALFIIGLTSFLVGLVIAYESLVQLTQFGADIFVVDGIGISITRELGPMIAAIVIAGRSASSYAAEIGTMKITEEISAMETMGFDPYYFLVIPRIIALVIAMPLLIFFGDIVGILGGMVATKVHVDISYSFFIQRLQEVLDVKHYVLGIVKGPFFALIIAATGCFHGFRVTGDTESIGIETTASVVHAIFFVIACDALFAIIYTQLGY